MTDIFYRMGKEFRWQDLRIPSYWVTDLRFLPIEFYRGFIGKSSITWQNMKSVDALKKTEQYQPEKKFFSVRIAEEYYNKNNVRYEAAESFASIPVTINGIAHIAGNIIGSPIRFFKGARDGAKERRAGKASADTGTGPVKGVISEKP